MSTKVDGNLFIITDFDDSMEQEIILPLIRQIQYQKKFRDGRIDLHINSFGGYTHLAFQLINLIEQAKAYDITVRTIVGDAAFSCGSLVAIAGSEGHRYIAPTAQHLIHYGTVFSAESTPEQSARVYEEKARHFKKMRQHYLTNTNIPAEDLDRLMNDDQGYIPAAKCIKWGLADHSTTKFYIGDVED
jgi:ATP-dependent protease ClpP protease subunit